MGRKKCYSGQYDAEENDGYLVGKQKHQASTYNHFPDSPADIAHDVRQHEHQEFSRCITIPQCSPQALIVTKGGTKLAARFPAHSNESKFGDYIDSRQKLEL
jgi:hypothetical protein